MTTGAIENEAVETCIRCGASMEWRHQTWQCGRCGLKLGCCEGEAASSDEVAPRDRDCARAG